jgi:hypothetical protein
MFVGCGVGSRGNVGVDARQEGAREGSGVGTIRRTDDREDDAVE